VRPVATEIAAPLGRAGARFAARLVLDRPRVGRLGSGAQRQRCLGKRVRAGEAVRHRDDAETARLVDAHARHVAEHVAAVAEAAGVDLQPVTVAALAERRRGRLHRG
jgi:hypothetical protein